MATKPTKKRVRLYGWSGGSNAPTQPKAMKMEDRPRSDQRYHTARWTRESRAFRSEHPLCEECKKRGILTPSQVVDHIIPVAICADFWDQSNWQALCKRCNMAKGNRDKRLINQKRR